MEAFRIQQAEGDRSLSFTVASLPFLGLLHCLFLLAPGGCSHALYIPLPCTTFPCDATAFQCLLTMVISALSFAAQVIVSPGATPGAIMATPEAISAKPAAAGGGSEASIEVRRQGKTGFLVSPTVPFSTLKPCVSHFPKPAAKPLFDWRILRTPPALALGLAHLASDIGDFTRCGGAPGAAGAAGAADAGGGAAAGGAGGGAAADAVFAPVALVSSRYSSPIFRLTHNQREGDVGSTEQGRSSLCRHQLGPTIYLEKFKCTPVQMGACASRPTAVHLLPPTAGSLAIRSASNLCLWAVQMRCQGRGRSGKAVAEQEGGRKELSGVAIEEVEGRVWGRRLHNERDRGSRAYGRERQSIRNQRDGTVGST